jgi:hypothetical protein
MKTPHSRKNVAPLAGSVLADVIDSQRAIDPA